MPRWRAHFDIELDTEHPDEARFLLGFQGVDILRHLVGADPAVVGVTPEDMARAKVLVDALDHAVSAAHLDDGTPVVALASTAAQDARAQSPRGGLSPAERQRRKRQRHPEPFPGVDKGAVKEGR